MKFSKCRGNFLGLCLFFLLLSSPLFAQHTLLGNSGLIIIPTATIDPDATVRISSGFIPHPYYAVDDNRYDNRTLFISLVFLPFVEVCFGLVRPLGETYGIGDRTTVFRFRCLGETKFRPALTLGMQDPFGFIAQDWAQRYSAFYLVASKSFKIPVLQNLKVHLGQGANWLRAGQSYLCGKAERRPSSQRAQKKEYWPACFGGVEMNPTNFSCLMVEYDTTYINFGFRIHYRHLTAMVAWLDGGHFSYHLGGHFSLFPRRHTQTQ